MLDNGEAVEIFENELELLYVKAHKSGLSWWWILRLVLKTLQLLMMRADEEYWLKGGS